MSEYVIAAAHNGVRTERFRPLDLPDAEHIHLHRRPDGTWHAVAVRRDLFTRRVGGKWSTVQAWVDVPADPERSPKVNDVSLGEHEDGAR